MINEVIEFLESCDVSKARIAREAGLSPSLVCSIARGEMPLTDKAKRKLIPVLMSHGMPAPEGYAPPPPPTLHIFRGVQGSGKSTRARQTAKHVIDAGDCHTAGAMVARLTKALKSGVSPIALAACLPSRKEVQALVSHATRQGYRVLVHVCQRGHERDERVAEMEKNFEI